jgi:hypothetical protein
MDFLKLIAHEGNTFEEITIPSSLNLFVMILPACCLTNLRGVGASQQPEAGVLVRKMSLLTPLS